MSYRAELIPIAAVVGLFILIASPILGAMIALVVVTLAAAALVSLVVALIASPLLIVASIYRHRHRHPRNVANAIPVPSDSRRQPPKPSRSTGESAWNSYY